MFQEVHELRSEDQESCQTFGIISTISDLMTCSVLTINLAISYAKQGFKVLLLDLNLTQPTLTFLFANKVFFRFTTNKIFEENLFPENIQQEAYSKEFPSNGLLTIIPASIDFRSRLKVSENPANMKSNLIKLLNFTKAYKSQYDFLIVNMPNSSDLKQLSEACLISDHNLLLIDQNTISITYGIDLVANLEAVHPLIEFKGLLLYNYKYNVNFVDDERPFIEQLFNLPVIATLPELPEHHSGTSIFEEDIKVTNYFKIFSQELFKFIYEPKGVHLSQQSAIIEVLIIANKAGIPLFTSYLKGPSVNSEKSTIVSQDEILASATLTAIVTGITEVIKEITKDLSGETKLIKQKHLNLIIENETPLRAMMLTHRPEELMRSKMVIFLKLFKQNYKSEIDSFIGVSKSFKSAQRLVEEVF